MGGFGTNISPTVSRRDMGNSGFPHLRPRPTYFTVHECDSCTGGPVRSATILLELAWHVGNMEFPNQSEQKIVSDLSGHPEIILSN